MDVTATIKKFGLEKAFDYLYKDPEDNLKKLLKWADRLSGKRFKEQIESIRNAVENPENAFHPYIQHILERVDPEVAKTFAVNFFINENLIGIPRQDELKAKYNCNIPWAILLDDAVHFFKGQVQPVSILRRPAADAMQIAGGGGVKQDGPGNIAVVLFTDLILFFPAVDAGIEEEIGEKGLGKAYVHLRHHAYHQLMGCSRLVVDGVPDGLALSGKALGTLSGELVDHVHDTGEIFDRVFLNVVKGLTQCELFDAVANHDEFLPLFPI